MCRKGSQRWQEIVGRIQKVLAKKNKTKNSQSAVAATKIQTGSVPKRRWAPASNNTAI